MYLFFRISMRKKNGVTNTLSKLKVGKDATSFIVRWLEEEQREWRGQSLKEKARPYLYSDATYLGVCWGGAVTSIAPLVCVGVDEEGFTEVLAVEAAGSQQGAACASLLRGLLERGFKGGYFVVSNDSEEMKATVAGELQEVEWLTLRVLCAEPGQGNKLLP